MPTCKKCRSRFPVKQSVEGVVRNLGSRSYCLGCSPFGARNTKRLHAPRSPRNVCRVCRKEFTSKKSRNRCPSCDTKVRRRRAKIMAVHYLGGICTSCGWSGDAHVMDFHHKDPNGKDFQVGHVANRRWAIVKKELDKCTLLCANCHRAAHATPDDVRLIKEVLAYRGIDFDVDVLRRHYEGLVAEVGLAPG